MKIGDEVVMSGKNPNHLGWGESAYSGMKGTVADIFDDNSFALDCGTSMLVVPLRGKSVLVYLNSELVKIKPKPKSSYFQGKDQVIGSFKSCQVCGKIPTEIYYNSSKIRRVWHCKDCDPKDKKNSFCLLLKKLASKLCNAQ